MRQIGCFVLTHNNAGRTGFGFVGITLFVKRKTFFCFEFVLQLSFNFLGVQGALGTLCPLRFDFVCRLLGMPSCFGHHCKTWRRARCTGQLNALHHTRHGQCFFCVQAAQGATDLRHLNHTGVQHFGQANINAKHGTAIGFGGDVSARYGLTNQRPIFAIFQADIFRCLTCSAFCKLTKVRRLAGGVADHALFNGELLHRHFPLVCGGQEQAGLGRGCGKAQLFPRIFNGRRSTRGIDAQFARHLAHNPLTTFDHERFFNTFGSQRMKWQGAHKHGHVAINSIMASLL